MNAEIRTECPDTVDRIHHIAQLWEDRWWGGAKIGIPGTADRRFVTWAQAFANDVCRNNPGGIWSTAINPFIIVDGIRYDALLPVGSATEVNPCRLP